MQKEDIPNYRNIFQVSPERIARLNETELNQLMGDLIRAQAYRSGTPISGIRINTEVKAPDDGCDGWSQKPTNPDTWLGATDTCWQFKAGSAGTPSRIKGEISKPYPKQTLQKNGRFVVVASGSKSGKAGEESRLNILKKEAKSAKLSIKNIEVFGSERLANWCNQHPSIAARWSGCPDGVWSLERWINSEVHRVGWQSTPVLQKEIEIQQHNLDFVTGSINHLHIQGQPGVGKTRLAMELCRNADWAREVVYIRQASDVRLKELIDVATSDVGVRLMIVADEVQLSEMLPLRDSLDKGRGRIKLITVGHVTTPDPKRIPALPITPLDSQQMTSIIKGIYPAMPPEHVDFVVNFADGYVRLAILAADAVVRDPSLNVHGLLDLAHIQAFMDRMLGDGDRRALHVVAVLSTVGWTEDKQSEGESIAGHLGLDWNQVRASIEIFNNRYGIVPRGGRYRYISPIPLGNYLAIEAWNAYPDLLRTLPDVLPTAEAKDAYYERLSNIENNPQAQQFARKELSFFLELTNFMDERAMRRWSALSSADPQYATQNILNALLTADIEQRRLITNSTRREAVWTLVRLAWMPEAYHNATMALALLAEAENETWANNATAEFIARFQIFLGGTALPYLDRLQVLDELLALKRNTISKLVIKALSQVGNQQAYRMGTQPLSYKLPEPEWRPTTGQQHFECIKQAIERLNHIAAEAIPDLQEEILAAIEHLSPLLKDSVVRDLVSVLFEVAWNAYPGPDSHESIRKSIADILHREKKYNKKLAAKDIDPIEALYKKFEGGSIEARIRQYLGLVPYTNNDDDKSNIAQLATDLLAKPEILEKEWPWLTAGNAHGAWWLGAALAAVDTEGKYEDILPVLIGRGNDLRMLCGYVNTRKDTRGLAWYDQWIAKQLERDPKDMQLFFEIVWRCGPTDYTTKQLVKILKEQDIAPHLVAQFEYGRWGEALSFSALNEVLSVMFDRGYEETVVAILDHRLRIKPEEKEQWNELAIKLSVDPKLIRGKQMANYYWKEVAKGLVPQYAKEIAAAVLREQATRTEQMWFAEFSDAAEILSDCIQIDPEGVWDILKEHLNSKSDAYLFGIGFPAEIFDHVPINKVKEWMAEDPKERAPIMAHIASKNLSDDNTLASQIIGLFGDYKDVDSGFFSKYVSGTWSGHASDHWNQLANNLDEVAKRTSLSKLRNWAKKAAGYLRKMKERDQAREAEEDLRRN